MLTVSMVFLLSLAYAWGDDLVILRDGRGLHHLTVLQANPTAILVRHDKGTEEISRRLFPVDFYKNNHLPLDILFLSSLQMRDGAALTNVRIVAVDADHCRLRHTDGAFSIPLNDLPDDVQKLVKLQLIERKLYAKEAITDPALRSQSLGIPKKSQPPAPSKLPLPPEHLEKLSFAHYATLPLKNGEVLKNAEILGLSGSVTIVETDHVSRLVETKILPDEVAEDVGANLYPLFQSMLLHGVVSRGRSPLLSLRAENGSLINFPEIAKLATGGRAVANVGCGYLLIEGGEKNGTGAAVELPKPLAGISHAFIWANDFDHIGSKKWREWWGKESTLRVPEFIPPDVGAAARFKPALFNVETLLLDPLEGKYTLFGNHDHIIKRAWLIEPCVSRQFAIVETVSGFYLGTLAQYDGLPESSMTWPQLVSNTSGRYLLRKFNQVSLHANQAVYRIDPSSAFAAGAFVEPQNCRLRPSHFRMLSEKGMEGVLAVANIPQSDFVEICGTSTDGIRKSHKEIEIVRVGLDYISETPREIVFQVEIQQRERETDQISSNARKPFLWTSKTTKFFREVKKDPDGGIRFTDGETVYEVAPQKVGGTLLIKYKVEKNRLVPPLG